MSTEYTAQLHLVALQRRLGMADLTNFTQDNSQKTFSELLCKAEFTGKVHSELIFLSVLNTFLSITAFLENTLILVALHKDTSLHPPSKLLFRNLAITDLFVGITAEPLYVVYCMSEVRERWDVCFYAQVSGLSASYILCAVSLSTMTAISVDRLLALSLGLRYRQVVTFKRTCVTITGFWICSIVGSSLQFLNPVITAWYQYTGTALCLSITFFAYTKIFFILRHNRIHVKTTTFQRQPNQAIPMNIARYRKAVYSSLWVQVTLVVCYLPAAIVVALTPQRGISTSTYLNNQFTISLVFLNSSLNPLLYCWKIREVRQAVKETLRGLRCSSN